MIKELEKCIHNGLLVTPDKDIEPGAVVKLNVSPQDFKKITKLNTSLQKAMRGEKKT